LVCYMHIAFNHPGGQVFQKQHPFMVATGVGFAGHGIFYQNCQDSQQ